MSRSAGGSILGRGGGVEAVRGASAAVDRPEIMECPLSFHRWSLAIVQVVVRVPSHGAAQGRPRQDGHCWSMGGGATGGGSVQSHAAMDLTGSK